MRNNEAAQLNVNLGSRPEFFIEKLGNPANADSVQWENASDARTSKEKIQETVMHQLAHHLSFSEDCFGTQDVSPKAMKTFLRQQLSRSYRLLGYFSLKSLDVTRFGLTWLLMHALSMNDRIHFHRCFVARYDTQRKEALLKIEKDYARYAAAIGTQLSDIPKQGARLFLVCRIDNTLLPIAGQEFVLALDLDSRLYHQSKLTRLSVSALKRSPFSLMRRELLVGYQRFAQPQFSPLQGAVPDQLLALWIEDSRSWWRPRHKLTRCLGQAIEAYVASLEDEQPGDLATQLLEELRCLLELQKQAFQWLSERGGVSTRTNSVWRLHDWLQGRFRLVAQRFFAAAYYDGSRYFALLLQDKALSRCFFSPELIPATASQLPGNPSGSHDLLA